MADQRANLAFVQNTGNPVLDSTVNITIALALGKYSNPLDALETVHAMVLKIAEKEPGGLKGSVDNQDP
jgi:hypothetical protein